ncbi:hypothetical protein [Hyphomonas sp.]
MAKSNLQWTGAPAAAQACDGSIARAPVLGGDSAVMRVCDSPHIKG